MSVRLVRSDAVCCSLSDNSASEVSVSVSATRSQSTPNYNYNHNHNELLDSQSDNVHNRSRTKIQTGMIIPRRMTEPWASKIFPLNDQAVGIDKSDKGFEYNTDDDSCDLGLGQGLKPGGLPRLPETNRASPNKSDSDTADSSDDAIPKSKTLRLVTKPVLDHYHLCDRHTPKRKWFKRIKNAKKSQCRTVLPTMNIEDQDNGYSDHNIICPVFPDHAKKSDEENLLNEETFPAFADVTMGTSIRQQKKLFQHDSNEILNRSPILNRNQELLNKGRLFYCSVEVVIASVSRGWVVVVLHWLFCMLSLKA